MGTTLKALLTFTNVPAGTNATLAHGINVDGLLLIPDHVFLENGSFTFVSATTTQITIHNASLVAASCRVLVELWHTIERFFGTTPTAYIEQFSTPPFVSTGGSGGGGGTSDQQAFTYTCTGLEGSDFFITLPAAQASDDYIVEMGCGGVNQIYTFDCPDLLVGDRTTTQFRVITSTDVSVGDRLDVFIVART